MGFLEKYDEIQGILNESGIRNIKALSQEYDKAILYFHVDVDGVTTGIGMKAYLKNYGIKVVEAHPIQYGDKEFAIPNPKPGHMAVLVDFAHGKPVMNIHTDHHDAQVGVAKTTSTSFVKTRSNAAYISQKLSPRDLFPPQDLKIINTIDSADFAAQNLTPEDVMRAVFIPQYKVVYHDKKGHEQSFMYDVEKNHDAMGYAIRKLVDTYKNKPGFLSALVMNANPSLISLYNTIRRLAKKAGYKPPEDIEAGVQDYIELQKKKIVTGPPSKLKSLKNGESMMVGKTICQWGGGMMRGGYDRYTPFKNHPDADYLCIAWSMGMVQISGNPFKSGSNPHHLGDLAKKILNKFKGKFQNKEVTLDYVKWYFEKDLKKHPVPNAMGFQFSDLVALFGDKVKGLEGRSFWTEMVKDITNKPYNKLTRKQKEVLRKVTISLWDLVLAQSGGHRDITNIQGLAFWGKGYMDIMRDVFVAVGKEMEDKRLKE